MSGPMKMTRFIPFRSMGQCSFCGRELTDASGCWTIEMHDCGILHFSPEYARCCHWCHDELLKVMYDFMERQTLMVNGKGGEGEIPMKEQNNGKEDENRTSGEELIRRQDAIDAVCMDGCGLCREVIEQIKAVGTDG